MSEATPIRYEPIAVSTESTVVAEFVPDPVAIDAYQSEAALEAEFIRLLKGQAYEYLAITAEADLVANLRRQLELLNEIGFSDAEWDRFFAERIAGANDGIVEKTVRIQDDHVQLLQRDDGSSKNVTLFDKQHIHRNRLQVIDQYEIGPRADGARYANRYDVTILVNGLPLVHVELKRRGVDIREAFNQIDRYQRDSFWSGSGLFEYAQLFVISNGTLTKYYSNTTRQQHLQQAAGSRRVRQTSNSFEFTSWWADATNRPIQDLVGFTKTFFAKHTILAILARYCVLTADRMLLVMRPYQIVAAERILQRIEVSTNYRRLGTRRAGAYVWHTTGSGKTLTSFMAAQLASRLPSVDKVLFVVDRKDLDYQTMREYDRFERGAANSNTSTAVLRRQLEDPNARIIQNYYKDLSLRLKDRETDLVIVVNMFLTGFDATTLNTLFVDKSLRAHGLIQAYSRTNRILNSVKTYGNIVSFRDLEQETNDALALFGNRDARGIVLLKPYAEYFTEYQAKVQEMVALYPLGVPIVGESAQKAFIALFGAILRLRNILTSFDDFGGNEILAPREIQDYQSVYLDLYADFRREREGERESINDDVVFEIELIKQVEINVDYILLLVAKYRDERGDGDDVEVRAAITRAVDASPSLRDKKDLIEAFVDSLSVSGEVDEQWRAFVDARRADELALIISEEGLKPDETRAFIDTAFRDGAIRSTGTAITHVLSPISRFAADGAHGEQKQRVLAKLGAYFERFFGLGLG